MATSGSAAFSHTDDGEKVVTLRCKLYVVQHELGKQQAANKHLTAELNNAEQRVIDLEDHLAEHASRQLAELQAPARSTRSKRKAAYNDDGTNEDSLKIQLRAVEEAHDRLEKDFDRVALELVDMKSDWLAAEKRANNAERIAAAMRVKLERYQMKEQDPHQMAKRQKRSDP